MTLPEQVSLFPVITVTVSITDSGSYRTISDVTVQIIVGDFIPFRGWSLFRLLYSKDLARLMVTLGYLGTHRKWPIPDIYA